MLKKEHLFSQVLLKSFFWGGSEIALKNKVPQLALTLITQKQKIKQKSLVYLCPFPFNPSHQFSY